MVDNLALALSAPEALTEAAEIVRQLIDRVVLEPQPDGGMKAMLYGDLAVLLSSGEPERRTANDPGLGRSGSLLSVVAETRNHFTERASPSDARRGAHLPNCGSYRPVPCPPYPQRHVPFWDGWSSGSPIVFRPVALAAGRQDFSSWRI